LLDLADAVAERLLVDVERGRRLLPGSVHAQNDPQRVQVVAAMLGVLLDERAENP
jgi:hypothetical protein